MKRMIIIAALGVAFGVKAQSDKLDGNIIGTTYSVDYRTGQQSTTVNTKAEAFDGNPDTYFASYDRSFTWVGLELDQPYVITKVGYMARNDSYGPKRTQLAVFQGANNPDFSDAMPIYLVPEKGEIGKMIYADVNCSKGFRYVRYVGPHDARCNIAEIEFYGYAGEGDMTSLYQPTNLPLVAVNTPDMEWFHDNDKEYAMEGSQVYVIDDKTIDIDTIAQIRGRGNASWGFPKKPFRIKFDTKQKVLGGPAKAKKWTMINNYGDKTLMRNMLAFEISRRIGMAFTPVCHPVDLIFNGEYQGTYQLCDQVEVAKNRVNITQMSPEDIEGEALTGGYLIEIDAYASQEPDGEWFYSQGGHSIPVTIKSPDPGISEQYNYIRSYFTQLEKSVFSASYGNENTGYRKYMDEDSFLRHFIVGELSGNTDTYWSVYMSLDRGSEKFVTGPCWDFDLAFENDNRTYPINDKNNYICLANGSFANGMKDFVQRIVKTTSGSKSRLSYIWSEARANRGFTADDFDEIITRYHDQLYESQKLNFKRWDIMNTYVHQNPKLWGSYDAEVENVRNYLRQRFDKLDKLIGLVEIDAIDDVSDDTADVNISQGTVTVRGARHFQIVNMQGTMMASGNGDATVSLPKGIYILNINGAKCSKLVIK